MQLRHSGIFSLIHFKTAGSAYKLSTGMSKKPWIWDACKSIVMMWSAPATLNMLATSLAEIGARLCPPQMLVRFFKLEIAKSTTIVISGNSKQPAQNKKAKRVERCTQFGWLSNKFYESALQMFTLPSKGTYGVDRTLQLAIMYRVDIWAKFWVVKLWATREKFIEIF